MFRKYAKYFNSNLFTVKQAPNPNCQSIQISCKKKSCFEVHLMWWNSVYWCGIWIVWMFMFIAKKEKKLCIILWIACLESKIIDSACEFMILSSLKAEMENLQWEVAVGSETNSVVSCIFKIIIYELIKIIFHEVITNWKGQSLCKTAIDVAQSLIPPKYAYILCARSLGKTKWKRYSGQSNSPR